MVLTANGRVRARAKVRASAHGSGDAQPAHEEPAHLGRYGGDIGQIYGRYRGDIGEI